MEDEAMSGTDDASEVYTDEDNVVTVLAIVLVVGILIGYAICATLNKPHELTEFEKQRIAVQVLCGPGSHWKGMEAYCGSLPADGR
jgi:hypothetical protein